MSNKSLWPSFNEIETIRTPKIILQEQATFLESVCDGFIKTETITSPHATIANKITHILKLHAPKVEDYTTTVVQIDHDAIKLYPLTVTSRIKAMPASYTVTNEEELLELLQKVFEEKETIETINSLLQQSKAIENYSKGV